VAVNPASVTGGASSQGDNHAHVTCAGRRLRRIPVEQQHRGGDRARGRAGGAGGDERGLRDRDQCGHGVDPSDDHGERRRRHANGHPDRESSAADGNADRDRDRPGGERVTSNPAGINVAVGSSGSASFAIGTAITLRATNERDVIWSGACSSGGNKTKTCTFTLNANAAVTANVQ